MDAATFEKVVVTLMSPRCFSPLLWIAGLVLLSSCASLSGPREREAPSSWTHVRETSEEPADVEAPAVGGHDARALEARIYEALARLSRAQSAGDTTMAERALAEAMADLRAVLQDERRREDPAIRELYRSVVVAFEQYYGVADTSALAYGDIFAFREDMFDALNQVEQPLLEEHEESGVTGAFTTIPLDQNRLVEQSIRYLQRSPDRHLHRWLRRAGTYFPMIESILREEGVPDELKYLAMVESGLNPRAVSPAGAVGMWQFMYATGQAYGLRRTAWIDERMDPEKSTRAAARHLRDLYDEFGDWHLALAAYNCGAGRVRNAVRRHRNTHGTKATFWEVYHDLPRETRNYVPMYIATVLVASDPAAYGVQSIDPDPPVAYERVAIEGMMDLRLAAELAGTDVETLRALNPEIRQWMTPPDQSTYSLRLPPGSLQRFSEAYAALPVEERQGKAIHHVRRGDTLSKLARRYGTTVATLQALNGLNGTLIRRGQQLYVPVPYEGYGVDAGMAAYVGDVGDAPPVRLISTGTSPVPADDRAGPAESHATRIRYHVRRGDNLTVIARRYGVSVSELRRWNDLTSDRIRSGQVLTVYPGGGSVPGEGRDRVYRVKKGDTLGKIARAYGVRVADLKHWNGLRSDRILPGQQLRLASSRHAPTTGRKEWVSYRVRRGDTLTAIARMCGATVAEVRRWNALRSDRLRVGQRLALYTNVAL